MSTHPTVSSTAMTQFTDEMYAYFSASTRLRNTVDSRTVNNAESVTFDMNRAYGRPKVITGRAEKAPMITREYDRKTVTPLMYRAVDYIDNVDELRTKHNLRQSAAKDFMEAFLREEDYLISSTIESAITSYHDFGDASSKLTLAMVQKLIAEVNRRSFPRDGNSYAILGAYQWNDLMQIESFSNADYVGTDLPWTKHLDARRWQGINWLCYEMPRDVQEEQKNKKFVFASDDGLSRNCVLYHKSAIGLVTNEAPKVTEKWDDERDAHAIYGKIMHGALVKNEEAIIRFSVKEER